MPPPIEPTWDAPDKRNPPRQRPWDRGVAVPLPAEGGFTPQEHWAWAQIIRGKAADMRFAQYERDDGFGDDPRQAAGWPAHRTLSARFLRTILCHHPWRAAPAREFVHIRSARFADEITLGNAKIAQTLIFENCSFGDLVYFLHTDLDGQLSFRNCVLDGGLRADWLRARGVYFRPFLQARRQVSFAGAQIDGPVVFTALEGADCGLNTLLNFASARIQDELQFTGPAGASIFRAGARLNLRNASAGALGATLAALSFRNDTGKQHFVPVDLEGFAYRTLGAQASPYHGEVETLADAPSRRLAAWLRTSRRAAAGPHQRDFAPHRYRMLAAVLSESGHTAKAGTVLKALADHELTARGVPFGRKLGLFVSNLLVRYGYGSWRALALFALLVAAGAAYGVYATDGFAGTAENHLAWARFALGNATPLLTLDESHGRFLADSLEAAGHPAPEQVKLVFDGQKALGFLLLTYLAAGLTGLASKPKA